MKLKKTVNLELKKRRRPKIFSQRFCARKYFNNNECLCKNAILTVHEFMRLQKQITYTSYKLYEYISQ